MKPRKILEKKNRKETRKKGKQQQERNLPY